MKTTLSDSFISGLTVPPGEREVVVFDTEVRGLHVRKFATGDVSFNIKYSFRGRQRRQRLKAASLDRARALAREVRNKVREDNDPRKAERGSELVGDLISTFLATKKPGWRPRYYKQIERWLKKNAEPLHSMRIREVTRTDIAELLDQVERKHGPIVADKTLVSLSGFFKWAVGRDYIDTKPTQLEYRAIKPNGNGGRERVLSDEELADVWNAALEIGDDYGQIVRLLILTGQRREEIGRLRWSEVNDEARQIELPGERTKNHRSHVIPLTDAAMDALPPRSNYEFVFGRNVKTGFSGWSHAKVRLEKIIAGRRKARAAKPMQPWLLHDLRRTMASGLAALGTPIHITEKILNHQSGSLAGVAGIYQRYDYMEERRAALKAWSKCVLRLSACQGPP